MRVTQVLCQQHIGNWFKKKWYYARSRVPIDTGTVTALQEKGIEVVDAFKTIYPTQPRHIPIIEYKAKLLPERKPIQVIDNTHPLWNDEKRHLLGDNQLLINGLEQAQHITKAICLNNLPAKIEESIQQIKFSPQTEKNVKNAILTAHLFDAEQKKLPRPIDPERPRFIFRRPYGITEQRGSRLIVAKLLLECDRLLGNALSSQRKIINGSRIVLPFDKDDILYQFDFSVETFVSSNSALKAFENTKSSECQELPSIYPLKCNISVPTSHLYRKQLVYPLPPKYDFAHPHTLFLHFSDLDVKNIHETLATPNQFESRALLKTFAAAAVRAKALYGDNVAELPEPITVQSVHIKKAKFQFGVFQLNTLNLNGDDGLKNFWFSSPPIDLYETCAYEEARPRLAGYNPDVLKHVLAFYQN